jgi:uncharacterized protein (TIGR02145 family)
MSKQNTYQNAFYAALRNRSKTLFNRYKVNTLADGGIVRDDSVTKAYMKMAQDNRMSDSIKFAWLGEAGIKQSGGRVSKLYGLFNKNIPIDLFTNRLLIDSNSDGLADGFSKTATSSASIVNGNGFTTSAQRVQTTQTTRNDLYFSTYLNSGSIYKITYKYRASRQFSGDCSSFGVYEVVIPANTGNALYKESLLIYSGTSSIKPVGFTKYDAINGDYIEISELSIKEVIPYNATQPTAANQPFLSGNIAPNERYALKNPNGGSNYMTHPTISFGATDAWSVSTVLNWNGSNDVYQSLFGYTLDNGNKVSFREDSVNSLSISLASFKFDTGINTSSFIGKNILLGITYYNGTLKLYLNGILKYTNNSVLYSFSLNSIFLALAAGGRKVQGTINSHIIHSQTLTSQQVTAEYNLLHSYYPEIPNVTIGTQTWATSNFEAVCTPQGNLIVNVTDNTVWASSQTLYDNAFNAAGGAGGGTAAIYAGVKAAAMWCHYNNDPAIGAVYGKLYNWFAVKLLQMDIDYYNAANPATPWGWRVPTQTDFQTLSTYLGGDAVSGGKLKMTGTIYWNSPNTGATNESGFSALGSSRRINDGTFGSPFILNTLGAIYSSDAYFLMLNNNAVAVQIGNWDGKTYGYSLRLIKA